MNKRIYEKKYLLADPYINNFYTSIKIIVAQPTLQDVANGYLPAILVNIYNAKNSITIRCTPRSYLELCKFLGVAVQHDDCLTEAFEKATETYNAYAKALAKNTINTEEQLANDYIDKLKDTDVMETWLVKFIEYLKENGYYEHIRKLHKLRKVWLGNDDNG